MINNMKKLLFILIFFFSILTSSQAATYYMATTGSNSNNGSESSPWLTLIYSISQMSGGDTLIIEDGTYSGSNNIIDASPGGYVPPAGSSGAYTTIRARNNGSVILDGGGSVDLIHLEPGGQTNYYFHFEGIIFQNSATTIAYIVRSNYIKFIECGFAESGSTSDSLFTHTCNYVLLEDCYSWGNSRYHFHFYSTNNSIMRRCVVRHDRGSYTFQIGFHIYNCQNVRVQNCIAIDSDQSSYYGSPSQLYSYKIPQDNQGNITFEGCIALNNDMGGLFIQAGTNNYVTNCLFWDTNYVQSTFIRGTAILNHCTIGNNQYSNSLGVTGDGTITVNNSIIMDHTTGLESTGGSFTSNYNSLYDNTTNYSNVSSGANDTILINPLTNSLLYLPRIEDSSSLDGIASDSGDIGSTIIYQIGTSGTLYGETGYDSTTENLLWPFPNETLIRTKMKAYSSSGVSGDRGFCTDGQTLTGYIMNYLGNGDPYSGLQITTTTLPNGTVGTAYSQSLSSSGGTSPYSYSVTTGSLPAGLSMSSAGAITGTPTTAQTATFTVTVTDSASPTPATDTQELSITIDSAPVEVGSTKVTLTNILSNGVNWTN